MSEREVRKPSDRWCVAREPKNPEICGPVVWSWHRWWWDAYWACQRLNRLGARHHLPPPGVTYYVLSQEYLDARWEAVGREPRSP